MLSVKEAAREIGVDPLTIYRYVDRGLKHTKVQQGLRNVIKIEKADLYKFIDNNKRERRDV